MKNKKLLSMSILSILITIFSLPVFGQEGTKVFVPSLTENGVSMITLSEASKQFGVDIERLNNNKSIICRRDDNSIQMGIDKRIVNINGKNIMTDLTARNINGVIYLPMRMVLESLDYSVEWDGVNKAIIISQANTDNKNILKNMETSELLPTKYIAHAGGRIDGLRLSNSKEAIEQSYRNGYKLIELDMEWSTDGNLVLVHDWGNFAMFVNSEQERAYSAEEFKMLKIQNTLTPLTIDDLANWLDENHGVYVVTDIKTSNVQALKFIKDRYPELLNRFVPQIYHFEEYEQVKNMGYENIIMTMYMSNYSHDEIVNFAKNNKLFAVTMPISTAMTKLPSLLAKEKIFVYAHTINTEQEEKELMKYNVNGFYTDDLLP